MKINMRELILKKLLEEDVSDDMFDLIKDLLDKHIENERYIDQTIFLLSDVVKEMGSDKPKLEKDGSLDDISDKIYYWYYRISNAHALLKSGRSQD